MQSRLNPAVRGLAISGIRRFSNLVAETPGAISLTIGQPDFPTPEHVREAGKAAIDAGYTAYTPTAGLPELRKAAAAFVQEKYGLSYDPATEVLVTIGASHAIDISLRTLLRPGDDVLIPAPVYPGYEPQVRMAGARPVFVDTRQDGFVVTPEALARVWTDKTQCVILPYPNNPTGAAPTRAQVEALAAFLAEKDAFVVSDEIYSELVYDEAHTSIAAYPGMWEKTVVIHGLSKSHSMTGWRVGFVFAPGELTAEMLKVLQYSVSCASSISQYAAVEALTRGKDDAHAMREVYRRRRDVVLERLGAMGLQVTKPGGAFYVFPYIGQLGLSSFEFASRLLREGKVAVVPGDAFSPLGEGYVRISYATDDALLSEAMDRMERFIRSLPTSNAGIP
ncbi:MAG: aminotransferase A [Thermoflavifilum sp.]|nr:aminotransferase A [Thermoflavifilum sp.]MCL6513166.1 aminotransferase A [Alicyclobacillus sp.]